MRAQMFKLAGVTNESDFYKKFPTEEAFMAKHGKALKKMQKTASKNMPTAQLGNILEGIGGLSGMAGDAGQDAEGILGNMGGYAGMMNTVGDIGKGLKAIEAGKEARRGAEQMAGVSSIAMQASMTPDIDANRHNADIRSDRYNSLMRPVNTEEFFPAYGVGTNVLAKKGATLSKAQMGWGSAGMAVANMYNEGKLNPPQVTWGQNINIPQGESSPLTTSKTMGQSGNSFKDFMGGYGGAQLGQIAGNIMGNDGGSQLGGTLGKAAGSAIGGPIGGAIGNVLGKVAGGLIDTNDNRQRKAESRTNANMLTMAGMNFGKGIHSQNSSFVQQGGQFSGVEEGIQPLWGGGTAPISYNPFTDGGGETGKFFGKSHNEGGIGINFAGNKVEAEGGEPFIKMQEGSTVPGEPIEGNEDLVIFGDLKISDQTAQLIEDPKAKGKNFKGYVNDIAKKETQTNKRKNNAIERAGILDENYKFDRLGIETQSIIAKGSNLKLKKFAELKENAAQAQRAIHETAEELGINPTILAKGGKKMEDWMKRNMNKAGELTRIPNKKRTMLAKEGIRLAQIGLQAQAKTEEEKRQEALNNFYLEMAANNNRMQGLNANMLDSMNKVSSAPSMPQKMFSPQAYEDPRIARANSVQRMRAALSPYNATSQNREVPEEKNSYFEAYRSLVDENNKRANTMAPYTDFFETNLGTGMRGMEDGSVKESDYMRAIREQWQSRSAKYGPFIESPSEKQAITPITERPTAASSVVPQKTAPKSTQRNSRGPTRTKVEDVYRTTGNEDGVPFAARAFYNQGINRKSVGGYGNVTKEQYDEFLRENSWYDFTDFDPKDPKKVKAFQEAVNERGRGRYIEPDGKFGEQTASVRPSLHMGANAGISPVNVKPESMVVPNLKSLKVPDTSVSGEDEKGTKSWDPSGFLSAISPLFNRGSDAEGLDGNQLLGEMFALSHNQVEPVYAQSYRPELDVPYDISLQDMLNRNTSNFRGAQRMSQGNPAAQAMLTAQKYGADQGVLAEEFRMNQGKKDQVYSGNRAALNDASLKNLAIFDQQFTRQSQAKSNTKQATQLALNSVSDKYLKNKLEQRMLKTYENMYNYRFGKDYRAKNVNDAVNFDSMEDAGWANRRNQPELSTPGIVAKYGTLVKSLKKF